jgi:hypothetical protein
MVSQSDTTPRPYGKKRNESEQHSISASQRWDCSSRLQLTGICIQNMPRFDESGVRTPRSRNPMATTNSLVREGEGRLSAIYLALRRICRTLRL